MLSARVRIIVQFRESLSWTARRSRKLVHASELRFWILFRGRIGNPFLLKTISMRDWAWLLKVSERCPCSEAGVVPFNVLFAQHPSCGILVGFIGKSKTF